METIRLVYPVEGGDLIEAGEASSKMKLTLKKLGLPQDVIRRASICMYEGEINMVIHADGGQAEVEVDKETGAVKVLNYTAVVDCGTPINPNLARVQTEGGIVQGIGMALFEDVTYNREGRIREDSLMRYKIPTRLDMGRLQVEFESSYEQTGPFGAKSIGEIVINTPAPAIAHAVYRATGLRHHSLPITPEKVLLGRDE